MSINKISIEGNIGCGKSSIISRLCQEIRLPVFLEPVDDWADWLQLFYNDPARWGMSFNTKVLLSFNKWKNNCFPAVYERSPISNRYVFSELQYDRGSMNKLEKEMFDDLYKQLAWTPDMVIYVRTDPDVSMERMIKRGRSCEKTVPLEYLQAVHAKYEKIFHSTYLDQEYMINNQKCIVHVIDGNRTHEEVYKDVVKCIKSHYTV